MEKATAAAVRASVERGDWRGLPTLAEAQREACDKLLSDFGLIELREDRQPRCESCGSLPPLGRHSDCPTCGDPLRQA